MKDRNAQTAEEFGRALQALREARGVSLETIAAKTKIAVHTLQALEAGVFARLPGLVFARMFLRQYVALLGEEPDPWVATFDALWRRWESSSQPVVVVSSEDVRPKTWVRWVVGFAIVAGALALVLWLHQKQSLQDAVVAPTPQTILQQLAPTPPPTPAPDAITEEPQGQLSGVILETTRACWVEWSVEGRTLLRQLLSGGQRLTLEVPEGGGELLLGDAGAVAVRFRDRTLAPAGRDGQVLRLRLPLEVEEGVTGP